MNDQARNVWHALSECRSDGRRTAVADAIAAVVDDLRRCDARSPAYWLLCGLLDGEAPALPKRGPRTGAAREVELGERHRATIGEVMT